MYHQTRPFQPSCRRHAKVAWLLKAPFCRTTHQSLLAHTAYGPRIHRNPHPARERLRFHGLCLERHRSPQSRLVDVRLG
ncbi:Uncharacterised protein [Vibrio cholerae]|nr:Uncharacterised protein [Vibrio cholerae]